MSSCPSKPTLRLDWCSTEAARYAVAHWHYSKTLPVNKTARLGVWEGGGFVGCVIFSCGSAGTGSSGKRFGLSSTQVAELARVALREHLTPVSRIVSVALRLLTRAMPGLRLIVSYADPAHGHVGGIYQAGGWVYVGRSAPDRVYVDRSGRRWHSRSVSASGVKVHCGVATRCPRISDLRAETVTPKYKYLMPLDDDMRARIAPLAQPYPKRERSRENAAAGPPAEGGVIPTRSLHACEDA